jgi:hypothetical protein
MQPGLREVRRAQLTVRSSQRLRPNQIETDYDLRRTPLNSYANNALNAFS